MKSLLYKLYMLTKHTKISTSVTLLGISGINIGHKCQIDPYCFLKGEAPDGAINIGDNVVIKRYSHISAKGNRIEIGEFGYIGYNNWIGGKGNITIGQNFISGMNVVIISSNHDYRSIQIPYYAGREIAEDIFIGSNVWIGANSTILPGITIGSGAVIGAGSVVTHDISENMLVMGAAAVLKHKINRRSSE